MSRKLYQYSLLQPSNVSAYFPESKNGEMIDLVPGEAAQEKLYPVIEKILSDLDGMKVYSALGVLELCKSAVMQCRVDTKEGNDEIQAVKTEKRISAVEEELQRLKLHPIDSKALGETPRNGFLQSMQGQH